MDHTRRAQLPLRVVFLLLIVICTVVAGDAQLTRDSADEKRISSSHQNVPRQQMPQKAPPQPQPPPSQDQPHSSGSGSSSFSSSSSFLSSSSSSHSSGRVSSSSGGSSRRSSQSSRASSDEQDNRASASSSDAKQRRHNRQLFSNRCTDCFVNGKLYDGHSRFEYDEGCQRHRCVCRCNGTHTCPPRYTLNICNDGEGEGGGEREGGERRSEDRDIPRRRCQECEVLGEKFEGNAYFDVQDGCTKYTSCVCYCNGSWVCPSERAINVCPGSTTPSPASACRACNAQGKVVAANSRFELEEPCRHYRHCRCHCNGSWECPAQYAVNTCQSPTARPQQQPGCKTCSVPGMHPVQGNTYFQRRDGCLEYKNCVCRCNGSWSCPSQHARNTCQGQAHAGSSGRPGSAHHLPASSAECQSCLAHGRYFRGNTYFNTRRGCLSYEQCVCRCDGSWDCPSRYVIDLCLDDDASNDVDNPNATCSFCDAEGKIVPPNSFFNLSKPCVEHQQCLCHCDGGWACPAMYSRDICNGGASSSPRLPQQQPEKDCISCHVNSRVVRGNSYFDFTSACYRYRDCLCKCDGTYHCEEGKAQNICKYSTTAAARSSSSSSSSSMVVVTPSSPGCIRCLAFGQLQESNREFVHEEDCVEYECQCHCNGTYTCPMERARRTCQPGCGECEVGGQFFEGNTYFQHTQGCVVYLCTCFCNGSYSCPPERANNTCGGGGDGEAVALPAGSGGQAPPGVSSSIGQSGRSDGRCQQCVTNDGEVHRSGTSFQLHEGCIHYQCQCHCDGSWTCPGQSARNICRGEKLGGCRSCVMSDSQIYHGGEEFQMRDGCIHYKCDCNCDGSWMCPGEKARDICLGEVPGGCRVCRVSRNETYRGGASFQLRQGCHHYQCQCHCNGSWECPGETARDVCLGEVPGGCRVCKLDSGEVYLGESDFQMVKTCVQYNCRCNCDGSWNCPGERARRVCHSDGSPWIPEPETTTPPPSSECHRCVASERESFSPNQAFTLRRGCNMYQCQCECDGSWHCPPSLSTNICKRRDDPQLRANTCSICRVSSYVFPGRSSFLLTRGCAQYSCQCDCGGRWTCDHRGAKDICQGGRGRSQSSSSRQKIISAMASVSSDRSPMNAYHSLVSNAGSKAVSTARGSSVPAANLGSFQIRGQVSAPCKPCRVEGIDRPPNRDFVLQRKCKRFHCHCSCNGRWRCPRNQTEELCAGNSYNEESSRRSGSAHIRPLTPGGPDVNRHGRAHVRVVSANSASSSSSSAAASQRGREPAHGELNVRGYYVNGNNRRTGQQFYPQADNRQQVSSSYDNNKQAHSSSNYNRQVSSQSYNKQQVPSSSDNRRQAYSYSPSESNNRQQVYSSSDNRQVYNALSEDNRQGVHSSSDNNNNQPAHSLPHGGVSSAAVVEGGQREGGCTPCQVDDRQYPTGAQFDWRRGCVVYKCTCLCSGSHRCRLSVDPDCVPNNEAPEETGGIPTGPAVEGPAAAQPGASCGNCYVQGLVYPGNMSFTLRQGCQELKCHCGCDGQHQCSDQKPIPGCTAMSTPLGNAMYPSGGASVVYPVAGNGARPGRVINTFQQTYYSNCPSCSQGQGQAIIMPVLRIPQQSSGQGHKAQASAQYSNHLDEMSLAEGGSESRYDPQMRVQSVPLADSAMEDPNIDAKCATCFVNGQLRQGDFHFTVDCSHVTCHCDCAGRLHCSVRQTPTPECLTQPRPERNSRGCQSCRLMSQEYSPDSPFALRVGCYGYHCTCECNGLYTCPGQQPTNYCVQPPQGSDGDKQPGHPHHHEDKAGLQDFTYSRSAELKEDKLLSCQDCDVRGTMYPSRSRFLLIEGCLQHTCDCACDGSWACAKNLTIDVCQQTPRRDRPDQEEDKEQRMSGQGRELAEVAAQQARLVASSENCQQCQVKEERFPPDAQFEFRQGCRRFTCHCFCNGSYTCPTSLVRNLCQGEELLVRGHDVLVQSGEGCQSCLWGNATYRGGSRFTHTDGCWQFACHCGCNGLVTCPPDNSRDLCRAGDSQAIQQRLREQSQRRPPSLHCKPCMVDGQLIRSRTAFNRREGCWEFLCQCQCNGSWTCPADRSLNVCQMDSESARKASPHSPQPTPRQGCKIGNKTYFTRLFAFKDGCVQHMCICYDSGAWRCPQGKERRLC